MKVKNMKSARGNVVPNQFIITGYETVDTGDYHERSVDVEVFQSYDSVIVKRTIDRFWQCECCQDPKDQSQTLLDRDKWNYSKTTARYRNWFLGETTKETQAKIDSGEYKLVNLN